MEDVLLYSLYVYLWFHLISRSDLLARPRGWIKAHLPSWLYYPAECSLCYTFWTTIPALAVLVWFESPLVCLECLFVAPVINYLIDLYVREKLYRLGSNTPSSEPKPNP